MNKLISIVVFIIFFSNSTLIVFAQENNINDSIKNISQENQNPKKNNANVSNANKIDKQRKNDAQKKINGLKKIAKKKKRIEKKYALSDKEKQLINRAGTGNLSNSEIRTKNRAIIKQETCQVKLRQLQIERQIFLQTKSTKMQMKNFKKKSNSDRKIHKKHNEATIKKNNNS